MDMSGYYGKFVDLYPFPSASKRWCGDAVAPVAPNQAYLLPRREPGRPVQSGQCDKSDTALQANYARLQPGGAVQHYEGLAGDRPNTAGAAGVYAAAGKLPG